MKEGELTSSRRPGSVLNVTLSIRYTIVPNKLADFREVEGEQEPIRRSRGSSVEYFLPTDFGGPTNEALGLIDFVTPADYER